MATLESAQRWGEKCKNRHFRPNRETGTQATLPGPRRLPVNGMWSPGLDPGSAALPVTELSCHGPRLSPRHPAPEPWALL